VDELDKNDIAWLKLLPKKTKNKYSKCGGCGVNYTTRGMLNHMRRCRTVIKMFNQKTSPHIIEEGQISGANEEFAVRRRSEGRGEKEIA
jgi:hypothetical protein